MLPKKRRIRRKDFPYILANGKRLNSPHFLLYLSPFSTNKSEPSCFSFSISKKVRPLASDRNKYRRQGYAAVSSYLDQVRPGYYIFFSFKKGSTPITFSVLEKEIKELLSSAGMLE